MFSGIIEATAQVLHIEQLSHVVRVTLQRPAHFQDIKIGDSISCNGVCLTIESFTPETLQFSLAAESLKTLRLEVAQLKNQVWNLERSLRFGDRVHGHLVTGHVEALGEVIRSEAEGESWYLDIRVPVSLGRYIWNKGSITLHGVSLTVNTFAENILSVCLIPETLKRTNLTHISAGQNINIETDYLAKAYFQGRDHAL